MPDSMAGMTEILPLLDTGEALMLGDAVLLPTRIRLDKPTIRPKSGTRDFWREWGTLSPDIKAIARPLKHYDDKPVLMIQTLKTITNL